jgi:hypothetical protein
MMPFSGVTVYGGENGELAPLSKYNVLGMKTIGSYQRGAST